LTFAVAVAVAVVSIRMRKTFALELLALISVITTDIGLRDYHTFIV
jgi:hypothetical protein